MRTILNHLVIECSSKSISIPKQAAVINTTYTHTW